MDCPTLCGDGVCEGLENAGNCPADCPETCGDEICTGTENSDSCPEDCPPTCGDGFCTGLDNASNCPTDCPDVCGDGFCTGPEDVNSCLADCPALCGDSTCHFDFDEDCSTCPADCGVCGSGCGNTILEPVLGEECDDGNTDDCDGCSSTCQIEDFTEDLDGDGVFDPCDNCIAVPNVGQEDVDEDGIGDPCDNEEFAGSLILGLVKGLSGYLPSGEGKGKLVIRGFVDVHPPLDSFAESLEAGLDPNSDGPDEVVLLLRVYDGADLNEFIPFKRSECRLKYTKDMVFLKKVICISPDKTRKAFFKKDHLVPDLFKFVVKAKKLELLPFQEQVLTGVLTTGYINRPDPIGNVLPCKINGRTVSRITCDEPVGF
jgi:cysteine-rich repeat protein